MNNIFNDLTANISSKIPYNLTKKMRKRKQLDAVLKFRLAKTKSNDILQSSEDESFLPHQNISMTKSRLSRSSYCWNYSQHILSFSLFCILTIVCIGFYYVNNELKNEVENLSLRFNEIEKKYSNKELNNIVSTIEQIKIRLNFLERWNFSWIYNQLQNQEIERESTQFSKKFIEFDILKQKTEIQLNSLRNENQSSKVQDLIIRLEQLTNLVHNTSDKTFNILFECQSNLNKLQNKINECKCSEIINKNKQIENTTDIEQIINQSVV